MSTTDGTDAGREARLRAWAHGPLWIDTHSAFEDGRFNTRFVAKVGDKILALAGEPYRFRTMEEAQAFGEHVQRVTAAILSPTPEDRDG